MYAVRRAIIRHVHTASSRQMSGIVRSASAVWKGNLTAGKGEFKTGSGKVSGPYNVPMRFAAEPGIYLYPFSVDRTLMGSHL